MWKIPSFGLCGAGGSCGCVSAPERHQPLLNGCFFVLKNNPSDLLELNFWSGTLPEAVSLQIKFPKWIQALNPWSGDGGKEDLLMEKPSSFYL